MPLSGTTLRSVHVSKRNVPWPSFVQVRNLKWLWDLEEIDPLSLVTQSVLKTENFMCRKSNLRPFLAALFDEGSLDILSAGY